MTTLDPSLYADGTPEVDHYPPVMHDAHVIEWISQRYVRLGLTDGPKHLKNRNRALTDEQRAAVERLRPTHTLKELARMFGCHPTTISASCSVVADHRAGNGRRPTRAAWTASRVAPRVA